MTIDEIIKKVEMVRDDLCDVADGARCQAFVLAEAVKGLEDTKKTTEDLLSRLEDEDWHFAPPQEEVGAVLAEFSVKPIKDEPPEVYYLVCKYDIEKDEWKRAIDDDLILDRLIAWKRII